MTAISVVRKKEVAETGRWDAEPYSPALRRLENALSNSPRLGELATLSHPTEIPRVYTDENDGIPFVLAANIRPILPNFSAMACISSQTAAELGTNRLQHGDVIVTRTGANHGVACVYLHASGAFYTSAEGLIVRPIQDIDGAYLGAFLGCRYGDQLCKKAAYGSGQPHIAPPYLRTVPVLRLGKQEEVIGHLIREGWRDSQSALPLYADAEAEMLEQLGWANWGTPKTALWYIENYKTVASAACCDPEFFSPRAKILYNMLNRDGRKIGDVVDLGTQRFNPTPGVLFHIPSDLVVDQ